MKAVEYNVYNRQNWKDKLKGNKSKYINYSLSTTEREIAFPKY